MGMAASGSRPIMYSPGASAASKRDSPSQVMEMRFMGWLFNHGDFQMAAVRGDTEVALADGGEAVARAETGGS